jgi:photosystem II stability/assembly factor-like uncharacterized protein
MRRVVAAILVLTLPAPAFAAVGSWSSLGPDGGPVAAVAVDPSNPLVVYAGSAQGGVFKSADGGTTWNAASRGLLDDRMVALAVNPRNPGDLVAASEVGVFASSDGAASWSASDLGGQLDSDELLVSLAFDPARPGTVYAGTTFELWVSRDDGRTWQISLTSTDAAFGADIQVAADPVRHRALALWVTFEDQLQLLASTNGGASWQGVAAPFSFPPPPSSAAELSAWQLAVDPLRPGALFIAYQFVQDPDAPADPSLPAARVYRSTDGGHVWHVDGPGGFPLSVGPSHTVYAGSQRSPDGGNTWKPIGAPPDAVLTLAAGTSPATVYAGGANAGVLRSADAGQTWQVASTHLRATAVTALAVDPTNSAHLYAYVLGEGLFASRNGGGRWRPLPAANALPALEVTPASSFIVPPLALGPLTLAIDPQAAATVYFASAAGLAKSLDAGATWSQIQPPCLGFNSLNVDPSAPATLFAAGQVGPDCAAAIDGVCSLFKSTDGGADWACLAGGLGPFSDPVLFLAPSTPSTTVTLYAFDEPAFGALTQPLYQSSDGGASWTTVSASLPGQPFGTASLVVDPLNAQRLFALSFGGTLWRSQDGGQHWRETDRGIPPALQTLVAAIDPFDTALLYAGSSDVGVYQSKNGGTTWQPLLSGLPPLNYSFFPTYAQLIPDPQRSGTLLLATDVNGVLTYTAP